MRGNHILAFKSACASKGSSTSTWPPCESELIVSSNDFIIEVIRTPYQQERDPDRTCHLEASRHACGDRESLTFQVRKSYDSLSDKGATRIEIE
jgi:hypothetical protein